MSSEHPITVKAAFESTTAKFEKTNIPFFIQIDAATDLDVSGFPHDFVIVIDCSKSMTVAFPTLKEACVNFIGKLKGNHRVCIVGFVHELVPFNNQTNT